MRIKSVAPMSRNYEIEGVITSMEVLPIPAGRTTAQMLVTVESGATMLFPAPNFIPVENEHGETEHVAIEGGTYDFPIVFGEGDMLAARSFIVPAVDKYTGEIVNSKRYVFADPAKGPVSLASVPTRDEYLLTDYPHKPEA